MMDYKTITNIKSEIFDQLVNDHIRDGWKPLGGVSISTYIQNPSLSIPDGKLIYDVGCYYALSMIREQ